MVLTLVSAFTLICFLACLTLLQIPNKYRQVADVVSPIASAIISASYIQLLLSLGIAIYTYSLFLGLFIVPLLGGSLSALLVDYLLCRFFQTREIEDK